MLTDNVLIETIKELAQNSYSELVQTRRYLHQHPELSFQEFQTSKYIASKLDELGLTWRRIPNRNGIITEIEGTKEGKGQSIVLRADIDALPIQEENNVTYKSQNTGAMHACGHDAHIAILLAVIRMLKDLKAKFSGTIRFLFQHAEERCPGGALDMINASALSGAHAIIGEHVNPTIPTGSVGFRSGTMMASADEIFITVQGRGGHAAMPQKLIDPVVIASHIILALQQVVSRKASPNNPTVLSFGKFMAQGATNVIPNSVEIAGTFRALEEEWRESALDTIESMSQRLAESMGARCEVRIVRGYPSLINDTKLTEFCRRSAIAYLGEDKVIELPLAMWSEDFAYYNQQLPGCFYNLGVGTSINSALHTATFELNEDALVIGSGLMTWLAISALNN